MVGSPTGEDRVLVSTRAVSAAIIPFSLLAFAVLVPWPTDTKRLFAWAIKPTMSAMVLGSVYLGGAYFFFRAARARRWHTVAGGFPPVATFAALMGIATILHWDRLMHGNLAFWLWVALYLTTPFVVFRARGYRREIDDEAIDAGRFDRAVDNALALSQDQRNAEIIDLLEPALGMWRSADAFGPCAMPVGPWNSAPG